MNENEARMTVVAVAKSLIEAGHADALGKRLLGDWLDEIAHQVRERSGGGGGHGVASTATPAASGVPETFNELQPGEYEVVANYQNTAQRGDPWTKLILGQAEGPNLGVSFFGNEHADAVNAKRGDRVRCHIQQSQKTDKAGKPLLNGSSLTPVAGTPAAPPLPAVSASDIPF